MLHIVADESRNVNGLDAFFVVFPNHKFILAGFLIKKTVERLEIRKFLIEIPATWRFFDGSLAITILLWYNISSRNTRRERMKNDMAMNITELHAENFEQEVVHADRPVCIDFWAPW